MGARDANVNAEIEEEKAIQSVLNTEGYFTRRIHAGERPAHGYPENHLPATTGARMQVRTSFMVARASHR